MTKEFSVRKVPSKRMAEVKLDQEVAAYLRRRVKTKPWNYMQYPEFVEFKEGWMGYARIQF